MKKQSKQYGRRYTLDVPRTWAQIVPSGHEPSGKLAGSLQVRHSFEIPSEKSTETSANKMSRPVTSQEAARVTVTQFGSALAVITV